MRIIAIDPGLTTGVASYDTVNSELIYAEQFTEPLDAMTWIGFRVGSQKATFLIEDYVGGGYRNYESNHTLKVLGFFYYAIHIEYGVKPIMRAPQQRLSALTEAKTHEGFPTPHAYDALAHAISYARTL